MNFMKNLIVLTTAMGILAGCGGNEQNNTQKQDGEGKKSAKEQKEGNHQEADQDGATLQLNNGRKWETDRSTRRGMQTIDSLVTAYDQKQALDSSKYQELGNQLKSEMQMIHQECSMEGQGHEELHKFITNIHPHIQNLKEGARPKAQQSFEKLKPLIKQYHQHFQ